jgi:hypothetical protein
MNEVVAARCRKSMRSNLSASALSMVRNPAGDRLEPNCRNSVLLPKYRRRWNTAFL